MEPFVEPSRFILPKILAQVSKSIRCDSANSKIISSFVHPTRFALTDI